MKLIKVDTDLVPFIWPYVSELLKKPLARTFGEVELDHVYYYVSEGYQDLWIIKDDENKILVACNAQIIIYPTQKVYQIILVGGEGFKVKEWSKKFLQDDSPLVQYAKEQDCVRIEAIVRDGFIKVLCKYGFKKTATLVNKILKEK
jgi:hypothetical protein|tara:strand:+ start:295 stop:732 length:438 start_codon:yes stop_codon:yes gene_type:complete